MPTTTRTAAAYIRVSTHGKQEELSPDAQKRLIREYAKKNHMYLPADNIYIESGISGKYARKRPQFQRMIAAAKTTPRPFDVILVWKFSRFARNQEESIVYKSLLRNKCGVDVVSISEPVIEGMFGDLIERIIEWMDEFYSVRLAEDVKRGMTEKALRGGFQTAPPLGYAVPIKGQPPVIVPEEAKAIRRIFHAYIDENMSMRHIAQELNQKDRRLASAEGGIIRKSSHPAIISEDLWDKAHEKRLRDYVPAGAKVSLRIHWLSGIVKCPNCGKSLVYHNYFNRNGSRYEYFQCHGYNTGKCTTANGIPGKKLEREVVAALDGVGEIHIVCGDIAAVRRLKGAGHCRALRFRLESPSGDKRITGYRKRV